MMMEIRKVHKWNLSLAGCLLLAACLISCGGNTADNSTEQTGKDQHSMNVFGEGDTFPTHINHYSGSAGKPEIDSVFAEEERLMEVCFQEVEKNVVPPDDYERDSVNIQKVINPPYVYYFVTYTFLGNKPSLYLGYLKYKQEDDIYFLKEMVPVNSLETSCAGYDGDIDIIKLKDGNIMICLKQQTEGENDSESECVSYFSLDGNLLFEGNVYYREYGDSLNNGRSEVCEYTIDHEHYLDGYPDIIVRKIESEYYRDTDSILTEKKSTELYLYDKQIKTYTVDLPPPPPPSVFLSAFLR